jgi:hypothetical protein
MKKKLTAEQHKKLADRVNELEAAMLDILAVTSQYHGVSKPPANLVTQLLRKIPLLRIRLEDVLFKQFTDFSAIRRVGIGVYQNGLVEDYSAPKDDFFGGYSVGLGFPRTIHNHTKFTEVVDNVVKIKEDF